MFYADGTHLTASGSQLAHPVLLTVANLISSIRQKDKGMPTCALLPRLNVTKSVSKKTKFVEFRNQLYQDCWKLILEDIQEAFDRGGFFANTNGTVIRLLPMAPFLIQDSEEVSP